jgi:hypothetical protein
MPEITDAKVEAFARDLYTRSRDRAQDSANRDGDRQAQVDAGLIQRPWVVQWDELSPEPRLLWLSYARARLERGL